MSAGIIAFGGLAVGILAMGGCAAGWIALGGAAFAIHAALGGLAVAGEYAQGGLAMAKHAGDEAAKEFFGRDLLTRWGRAFLDYAQWWCLALILVPLIPLWSRRRSKKDRSSGDDFHSKE